MTFIPQRLKKLFHIDKKQNKKKSKLIVYNYTSNIQPYPNQPQPPSPRAIEPPGLPSNQTVQLSNKQLTKLPSKKASTDAPPDRASPQEDAQPDLPIAPTDSVPIAPTDDVPIAPNDPTPARLPSHLATEEIKQHQEQANLLISETMRRKSTIPVFDTLLERYDILQKLGDGAFSNVYRGLDTKSGQSVAIKVARKHTDDDLTHLHPNMKKKPRVTERANILKEVKIMQNIDHPNIIRLNQFMESKENYFLVMDLCDGGELFHRIVDLTYFSEDLSRHIMAQLAQAIYHLHEECGVVHRDIKPENILFDAIPWIPSENPVRYPFDDASKKDEGKFIKGVGGGGVGRIKLADFGLSKIVWDTKTGTPCGTMGYAAPEIVTDQTYSKGVDMWAIGCVLYTMLCGFPPFYDESISALTKKVARGEYTFLSPWWDPISTDAKDLIEGLLCVDPRKRYTIRQVLQHPWLTGALLNSSMTPRSMLDTPPASNPLVTTPDSVSTVSTASSGASTKRKDIFSPDGLATLKEIFDITTAVQRMAEENTPLADREPNHAHRPRRHDPWQPDLPARDPSNDDPPSPPRAFALNLNNATLLKNREKRP
ncbi:kinase-like domain-containing protein [Gongronella butleri]|nr:kinase-like domain-containing protein [Gongronella butleri]